MDATLADYGCHAVAAAGRLPEPLLMSMLPRPGTSSVGDTTLITSITVLRLSELIRLAGGVTCQAGEQQRHRGLARVKTVPQSPQVDRDA